MFQAHKFNHSSIHVKITLTTPKYSKNFLIYSAYWKYQWFCSKRSGTFCPPSLLPWSSVPWRSFVQNHFIKNFASRYGNKRAVYTIEVTVLVQIFIKYSKQKLCKIYTAKRDKGFSRWKNTRDYFMVFHGLEILESSTSCKKFPIKFIPLGWKMVDFRF